jgi:hypothetical protein
MLVVFRRVGDRRRRRGRVHHRIWVYVRIELRM